MDERPGKRFLRSKSRKIWIRHDFELRRGTGIAIALPERGWQRHSNVEEEGETAED